MNKSNKKKVNYIYTITCMADIPPYALGIRNKKEKAERFKEYNAHGGRRVFGWFTSRKKAVDAVLNNRCDIHEYSYKYAVIERAAEGIHGALCREDETWFKWNDDNDEDDVFGAFEPIEKPEVLKQIIGWGIG